MSPNRRGPKFLALYLFCFLLVLLKFNLVSCIIFKKFTKLDLARMTKSPEAKQIQFWIIFLIILEIPQLNHIKNPKNILKLSVAMLHKIVLR